jgi:predicted MPP superfamily phosphohydrolase
MALFLFAILSLYGSLHLYIFIKIRNTLAFGVFAGIPLALFMALMVSAPVLVRIFEKHGFEFSARLVSYIGYTWMGLAFLFFAFSLAVEAYSLLVRASGLFLQTNLSLFIPSPRTALAVSWSITVAVVVYGYFEARHIRNDTLILKSPKIPIEIGTLTIVQISDIHLGLIVRHGRLERILRAVDRAKPDLLVSTGDLVDGQIDNLAGLAELLRAVNPKYGKFAVTGNHEFYAGLDQALDFTERAGFTVLKGETWTVAGVLNIAGLDDPTGAYFGLSQGPSESDLLSQLPPENFTVLLKHQPLVNENALGLFDLQLSGHTHKGQIFPFSLLTRLFFRYFAGQVELPRDSHLYVSRGSGTWGPPIRVLSPPEVTVVKLMHENNP